MGIVVDKNQKENVVVVKRIDGMILIIFKISLWDTINMIKAYAPQVGLKDIF